MRQTGVVLCMFSHCTESGRNLRRNIDVADDQHDQVGERFQSAEPASAIFHNFGHTVQSLTDGVGQSGLGKCKNGVHMLSHYGDKAA